MNPFCMIRLFTVLALAHVHTRLIKMILREKHPGNKGLLLPCVN